MREFIISEKTIGPDFSMVLGIELRLMGTQPDEPTGSYWIRVSLRLNNQESDDFLITEINNQLLRLGLELMSDEELEKLHDAL